MLCGLARLIMCIAEVPFFYLSGPLIRRVGVRGVIALTQVAYLTRFIYYSVSLVFCRPPRTVDSRELAHSLSAWMEVCRLRRHWWGALPSPSLQLFSLHSFRAVATFVEG